MTLNSRKIIRCSISITLDILIVLGISYLIFLFINMFKNSLLSYIVLLSVISASLLVFIEETRTKLFYIALLVILPYIGISMVVFFWLEKIYLNLFIKNKRQKNVSYKTAQVELEKQMPEIAKVARYVDYCTDFPLLFATEIELIESVEDYLANLIDEINNAKQFILLEFYIIENGDYLSKLISALFDALKRGVKVSLTVDYFGSGNFLDTFLAKSMKKAGAIIKIYKPPLLFFGFGFNIRTHRKIAVIDGKTGFLGGINLRDERMFPSKDIAVKVTGDCAKQLENMIYRLEGGNFRTAFSGEGQGLGFVQPFSVSGKKTIEGLYLSFFGVAKEEVLISTPYFSFNDEIRSSIKNLLKSGVIVKILLPMRINRAVWLINHSFAKELNDLGAEIYYYHPKYMHEKLIIIDKKLAMIGSSNFDIRSSEYQIESSMLLYDNRVIDSLLMDFNLAVANSERATDSFFKLDIANWFYQRILKVFSYFI